MKPFGCALSVLSILFITQGCAHHKALEPVSASSLKDKKVALAEIEGTPEAKIQIEVAVVNEILEHGWFEIIDKKTVQDALVSFPTESDWQKLGKTLGADYILAFHVAEFRIIERQGHDKVEEPDSELTEEMHSEKPLMGSYYTKVKSDEGHVKIKGTLFDVAHGAITYQSTGAAQSLANSRDTKRLSKLHMLESLTNTAIHDFFLQIPQ